MRLGRPVIVENMPGAGGILGTRILLQASADGYTLAVVATNHLIIPLINQQAGYDAVRQFTPICMLLESCGVLAARPGFPARTAGELVSYARANPDKVNFGTSGLGTAADLQGRLIQSLSKIQVVNVPYKGVSGLVPDLMSGAVDVAMFGTQSVLGSIRSGSLLALGITRNKSVPALPNVPPISESVPGFDLSGWYALIGPAGLSSEVVQRLTTEISRLQNEKSFIDDAVSAGETPRFMASAELAALMRRDSEKLAELIRNAAIDPT